MSESQKAVIQFLPIRWNISLVWRLVFPSVAILVLLASVATGLAAPITLELTGGSLIKGDLVSWNGQQAVVKAELVQQHATIGVAKSKPRLKPAKEELPELSRTYPVPRSIACSSSFRNILRSNIQ